MQKVSYKRDKKHLTFREGHTVGSSLYPLSQKKNIGVWGPENTEDRPMNPMIKMYLEGLTGHQFRAGKCYQNAEALRQVGIASQQPIEYHSGWLFMEGQQYPVHHAWNVLNGRTIIDASITNTYLRSMQRVKDERNPTASIEEQRNFMAEVFIEEEKRKGPISEEILFSKVPTGFLYIGTKDDYESSINRFHECLDKHPDHPTYAHKRNAKGESPLQEKLIERGFWTR